MSASDKTRLLQVSLERRSIAADYSDAHTLRRAEKTLQRWHELECGDGNDYASWAIERDEQSGKPYMVTYPHDGKPRRRAIADREKGAIKRAAEVCKRLGVHFYVQTDPRGCALYVSREPLTDSDYNRGVACCD